MNAARTGLALALATFAALSQAHNDESHPSKKRAFDGSKVEERAFGREGDPREVVRTIKVEMSDGYRFSPSNIVVKRGETVKFLVSNGGQQLHEMVLGTKDELQQHAELMRKFPTMEHADANMAHVKGGGKGEIVWLFNKVGEYQFACLIPGHFEAGMVGKVVVE